MLDNAVRLAWSGLYVFGVLVAPKLLATYTDFGLELPIVQRELLEFLRAPSGPLVVAAAPQLCDITLGRRLHATRILLDLALLVTPIAAIALCYLPLVQLLRGLS